MSARPCPLCRAEMEVRPSFGIEIDVCPACGGVFLDPGEAEAQGVDTAALFGTGPGSAAALGDSTRPCPVHAKTMTRWQITGVRGPAVIERASCCGGIFLDPGEQSDLVAAAAHASRLAPRRAKPSREGAVQTATGAVFAAPPPIDANGPGGALGAVVRGAVAAAGPIPDEVADLAPEALTERRCPRCDTLYEADRTDGVEIDVCPRCGSLFFDPGEIEARGVDTAALFGVGPEAARDEGRSELPCPAHGAPMNVVRITTLAGLLEVDRATCCGGLFLDGGEHDAFARAARAAAYLEADRRFARDGSVAGEGAVRQAIRDAAGRPARGADALRRRVDAMVKHLATRRAQQRWDL